MLDFGRITTYLTCFLILQMVKAIKVEVEETPPEHKSADVATSTSSSTNCPLFLFNRPPLMPVFWPSIIPSQNPVPSLHGRQSATVIPSNIDMPGICRPDISQEQDNHIDVNNQYNASSSSNTVVQLENHHYSLPVN